MAKRLTKTTRAERQNAYLTKRTLVRATRKASTDLSKEAMRIKGYVVKAEGKWVVKIYDSGMRERLAKINLVNLHQPVVID